MQESGGYKMLKLDFRRKKPEAEQKTIRRYTRSEVNEISIAATSLRDFLTIMDHYAMAEPEDHGEIISAITIMEWLIEPVADFLSEGCPMAKEKTEDGSGET
jgi:hypothetical protein